MERSPVPSKPQADAGNSWDLTNYFADQSKTLPNKSAVSSSNNATAANTNTKASVTSNSKSASNAASGQTEKRPRGRPRKEECKNPDPDFEPAKIQPTTVPSNNNRPVRKGKV